MIDHNFCQFAQRGRPKECMPALRAPGVLERRVKELNLRLVQPSQGQILRLTETPLGETKPRNDLLMAGRNTGPNPTAR